MDKKTTKKKKKNSKQFNRKFRHRSWSMKSVFVLVLAVILIVGVTMGYRGMDKKREAYEESIEELNTELEELENQNSELKEQMDNMDSSEFKEKMAREKLGMIGKDEVLLKESEDGSTGRGTDEGGEETSEASDESSESEDSEGTAQTSSEENEPEDTDDGDQEGSGEAGEE